MGKKLIDAGTNIYPVPAVLVSCGANINEHNLITIAWTGTICSKPPMCYISIRKNRHSYDIIKKNGDFVINLTTEKLLYATDWCGFKSGKDFAKFDEMNLTAGKASKVKSPIIEESPVNIECKVKQIIPLGTHDMFMAEVVAINIDEDFQNRSFDESGESQNNLICYANKKYHALGDVIGEYGFSVKKAKK